jgi:subtilase family serine protease
VVLRGSRTPRVDKLSSDGPVADTMRIRGITFRFRPTPRQQSELEQLLGDQQNPASPHFHEWLTPEEYADRFGLGSEDLGKVADWITSQGFQIDAAARSRTYLTFSGTAAQVRDTFATELHRYHAEGKTHFANIREAALPAELEPLILSLQGLDDFTPQPAVRVKRQLTLVTAATQ